MNVLQEKIRRSNNKIELPSLFKNSYNSSDKKTQPMSPFGDPFDDFIDDKNLYTSWNKSEPIRMSNPLIRESVINFYGSKTVTNTQNTLNDMRQNASKISSSLGPTYLKTRNQIEITGKKLNRLQKIFVATKEIRPIITYKFDPFCYRKNFHSHIRDSLITKYEENCDKMIKKEQKIEQNYNKNEYLNTEKSDYDTSSSFKANKTMEKIYGRVKNMKSILLKDE